MLEIEKLEKLESLNLYGTAITDAALVHIKELPNLTDLYLWRTDVKDDAITAFLADNGNLTIHAIDDNIFGTTELMPPTIITDSYFVKDVLEVEMSYPFDDTAMFYTLDGSLPDTTSTKYKGPIAITTTTTLKAITYKEGWGQSDVVTADFKKRAINYEEITLNKPPHEKYTAMGGKTLIDLDRGSRNFVDGKWIGYEGSHFNATIAFSEVEEISSVSIGALSGPSDYIFYPAGFNILVSNDGNTFKTWHSVKLPEQKPSSEITMDFFDLEFKKTNAKYVKVEVKSILKNPSWHQNPGAKSWVFIDEIVIN
jgi:hypothetical protein